MTKIIKKFVIVGEHIEKLPEVEIEASSIEEAEEKYTEMWNEGELLVNNNDFNITIVKNPDENKYVQMARSYANLYNCDFTFYNGHIESVYNWSKDDIYGQAKNANVALNDDEVDYILLRMYNNHDATIGINWNVIDSYIQEVIEDRS